MSATGATDELPDDRQRDSSRQTRQPIACGADVAIRRDPCTTG